MGVGFFKQMNQETNIFTETGITTEVKHFFSKKNFLVVSNTAISPQGCHFLLFENCRGFLISGEFFTQENVFNSFYAF